MDAEWLFDLDDGEIEDLVAADRTVPASVLATFAANHIDLDEDLTELVVESPGRQWRLLDCSGVGTLAWRLQRVPAPQPEPRGKRAARRAARRARRKKEGDAGPPPPDWVEVHQPTLSGLSPILWDHHVFEGVWDDDGDEILLVNGHDRPSEPRARRKWDYFFRPAEWLVGAELEDLASDARREERMQRRRARFRTRFAVFWLVVAGAAGGAAAGGQPALALGAAPAVLFALLVLRSARSLRSDAREQAELASELEKELAALVRQVPSDVLSDDEIDRWLLEELQVCEADAVTELDLDRRQILALDPDINEPGFQRPNEPRRGILLWDWGWLQGENTLGRDTVPVAHLRHVSYVGADGEPRFPILYVQLVFPTDAQLAVSGFFYDFLTGTTHGVITAEYMYRNVVSVGTRTLRSPMLSRAGSVIETTEFTLTVASGDSISVALTDEVVLETLDARLARRTEELQAKKRRQLLEERLRKDGERKGDKAKRREPPPPPQPRRPRRRISLTAAVERKSRASRAIAFIRRELRGQAPPEPAPASPP